MFNINYVIRDLNTNELPILEDLLYEAIFQENNSTPLPKEIINKPELNIYINNWGKKDDYCLVAEADGKLIGAVWTRIICDELKGYGNIDSVTPEFAISLFPDYRNKGIGTELMKHMIKHLKLKGYTKTSLSVDKNNYAFNMYKKLGFEIIKENEEDYLMILTL